jgi:hypothetical protein
MNETSDVAPPPRRRRVGERLRAKVPEILLEATSVVFAVLLALGVDEWRQDRENVKLAARARESIMVEIRTNRDRMRRNLASNRKSLAAIAPDEALGPDSKVKLELGIAWLALSSAAWHSAQTTQATRFLDYKWLMDVAGIYENQAMYVTSQVDLFQHIGGAIGEPDKRTSARAVRGRLFMLLQVAESLIRQYSQMLGEAP